MTMDGCRTISTEEVLETIARLADDLEEAKRRQDFLERAIQQYEQVISEQREEINALTLERDQLQLERIEYGTQSHGAPESESDAQSRVPTPNPAIGGNDIQSRLDSLFEAQDRMASQIQEILAIVEQVGGETASRRAPYVSEPLETSLDDVGNEGPASKGEDSHSVHDTARDDALLNTTKKMDVDAQIAEPVEKPRERLSIQSFEYFYNLEHDIARGLNSPEASTYRRLRKLVLRAMPKLEPEQVPDALAIIAARCGSDVSLDGLEVAFATVVRQRTREDAVIDKVIHLART